MIVLCKRSRRLCHPVRLVTMSRNEFHRMKVIENAAGGRLSVREAVKVAYPSCGR
jgi:hypothetical protein